MRKHIFVSAFIVLTVGCQPSKDGTLLTQYETDLKNTGKHQHDTLVTKVQGYGAGAATTSSPSNEISLEDRAAASSYDAIVRLRMDLAGTVQETEETKLLEKLFSSTQGPASLPVQKAIEAKKIPFSIQLTEEQKKSNEIEISILAQAFKQIAVAYGFDEKSQDIIVKAITIRSRMLAPLESQKQMAAASGELLQEKINDLIKVSLADSKTYCSKLNAFLSAAEGFYGDTQYSLPSLLKNKINYIKSSLGAGASACTLDKETLMNVADAVAFDMGSLELYLTPRNTFNWEQFDNFKLKAPLAEAVAHSTGVLSPQEIFCKKNGEPLKVQEGGQAFDLLVNGAYPLTISKVEGQQGLTVAFISKGVDVTNFQKMTLTKIKPDVLVPAVSLIPGESREFQFQYLETADSAETLIACKVGK